MARRTVACLAFVAAAILFGSAATAKTIHVDITKLVFAAKTVTANVGDTVEWTNHDIVAHTATARDKSWDVVIPVGATASHVMETAGSVAYFCRFHPNMKGVIEVSP